jgi:hypothetical protein
MRRPEKIDDITPINAVLLHDGLGQYLCLWRWASEPPTGEGGEVHAAFGGRLRRLLNTGLRASNPQLTR